MKGRAPGGNFATFRFVGPIPHTQGVLKNIGFDPKYPVAAELALCPFSAFSAFGEGGYFWKLLFEAPWSPTTLPLSHGVHKLYF